jgi:hypothetical protein
MPINKKQLLSIIAVLLVFLGWSLAEQGFEFKTLLELKFDKEIADVAFDFYEENGQTKFYPKVVVLREIDRAASRGPIVNYALEVRILNRKGKVIKKISDLKFYSRVYFSKNGKYFGVEKINFKDPFTTNQGILSESFTVYNDKGNICWQRKENILGLDYGSVMVNSQNGSVFVTFTSPDLPGYWKSFFNYFDTAGNYYPIFSDRLPTSGYSEISENGEFLVVAWKNSEPSKGKESIALIDKEGKLIWERMLEEPNSVLTISKGGNHIFAGGTNSFQEQVDKTLLVGKKRSPSKPKVISSSGYIFSNKGELLMKLSVLPYVIGGHKSSFSRNEQNLLFSSRDYKESPQDLLIGVNLKSKSEFFRVLLPEQTKIGFVQKPFAISDAGDAVVITNRNFFLLNSKGQFVANLDITGLETEEIIEGIYKKTVTLRLLGWNSSVPINGWIGHKARKLKVMSIEKRS